MRRRKMKLCVYENRMFLHGPGLNSNVSLALGVEP